jgi:hypothetical protein
LYLHIGYNENVISVSWDDHFYDGISLTVLLALCACEYFGSFHEGLTHNRKAPKCSKRQCLKLHTPHLHVSIPHRMLRNVCIKMLAMACKKAKDKR